MYRTWITMGVYLSAVAGLLLWPDAGQAQVRIGVGIGGGRGGVGFYYGNYPAYRGFYPGYYPGYYGYYGYGRNPYYYPQYGVVPYVPRYYTPYVYVPRYTTVLTPGYTTVPYYVPDPVQRVDVTPRAGNIARIEVRVPPGATVWFDGTRTQQTGAVRSFVSPELVPGYDYTYVIRATWVESGKEVTQERKLVVQAGQDYSVDFTGEALSSPQKSQP